MPTRRKKYKYEIKDERIIERKGEKIRKYKKFANGQWISKTEKYKGK